MRRRVLLLLCAVLAAGGGIAACTKATSARASDDDDASPGDAADELVVSDKCGDAPWVSVGLAVKGATIDNPDGSPLPGAIFTSPLCPAYKHVSDEAGVIEGQVSKDVPFYARLQAAGFVSMLAPEESFSKGESGIKITMLPALYAAFVPGFGPSSTAILIGVQKGGADAGACNQEDGVSFAVDGHPEATVTYYSADSIPSPTDAGATSARGLAAITGLTPNQLVKLTGAKTGCTVSFKKDALTGRVPLEAGFVSLMPAYLSD